MATQVSYSELSEWLSSQPDNTPSTPYELTVTDIPEFYSGRLRTILRANPTKYVDLSTTVQPKLYRDDFNGCTTLIKSPSFLSSNNAYLTSCFQGCSNLIEVQPLPDSVQWVNYCFSGCTSLTTVHSLPSSLVNMNRCFVDCTSLITAPAIPNTVENMEYCFNGCTSLTTVQNLPSSATTMAYCFLGCTSLVTVPDLPNSVTNVKYCFRDCSSLVTAPVIPNSATDMKECFYNCTSLTTVQNISSSVTKLEQCFQNCTSLTVTPIIPNSVTDMYYCFSGCTSLTTITNLPDSVEKLDYSFRGCTSLTTVPSIPATVTSMLSCFEGCTSLLATPYISSGIERLILVFNGCTSLTTVTNIPSSVTKLEQCFQNCTSLTTVPTIPNHITDMEGCFSGCTSLTSIDFELNGDAMVNMYNCFGHCTSLTTVIHLPSKISSMKACFLYCSQLTTLPQIPNTVTNMEQAFNSCTALTAVSFEDKAEVTGNYNTFYNCSSLQTIQNLPTSAAFSIPDSITYISFGTGVNRLTSMRYKFQFKRNLVTAINVPVLSDMTLCFNGCTSLETVSFRQTDPSISADMSECFVNCRALTTIQNFPTNISNMYRCFVACNSLVTAPRIPDSVTSLEQTFYASTALTTVPNLPSSVTNMENCFRDCTALETVPPIPSTVTNMKLCFNNCTSLLTTPYIPNSVTNMSQCFSHCTSLETVTNLPSSVTNLHQCFANCTSLTTINDFQVSKETLENNAQICFQNCSALTKIVVHYNETTDWHVFRLDFGSTDVSGKVYDKNGTAVAIPTTTITKSKLVMPVLSDELLFTDTISDADLDDLIADILEYKYTYTTKEAIDPTRKSLVLWADNPDNVITNLSFPADVSHASGVLPVANGGTNATTAGGACTNLIGALSVATGDVTDDTDIITSNADGYAEQSDKTIYKRKGIKFWNYIKSKISSVLKITLNKHTIQGSTVGTNTFADTNPKIVFSNGDGSQAASLTFTDYDSVQAPASLTLNGNQGGEYFIAPNIKATNTIYASGSVSSPSISATTFVANGYQLKRYYAIDASGLSASNFYPVTFNPSDLELDCEIHSPNLGGGDPYNQNHIHFLLTWQGWSDTPKRLTVLSYGVYDAGEITIGCIGTGNQNGANCVWVRGGRLYRFYCNRAPTLRTADWSYGNEKFTVGTSQSGGTNANVTVALQPSNYTAYGSYFKDAVYAQVPFLRDSGNAQNITASYNKAGLSGVPSWLTAWNGYELRAVSPNNIVRCYTDTYFKQLVIGGSDTILFFGGSLVKFQPNETRTFTIPVAMTSMTYCYSSSSTSLTISFDGTTVTVKSNSAQTTWWNIGLIYFGTVA